MSKYWISPAIFIGLTVFDTVLAWRGSQFALIMLAVISVMLAVFYGLYAPMTRSSLDGWKRTTEGWAAAQEWGMKQDTILRDVLQELKEYDEEAVKIHNGRSASASLEYLNSFEKGG